MMDAVKNYYTGYSEENRLKRDNFHRIEFLTSMRYLEKAIPPSSRILDACAGTGIYSFALAQQGHSVTACDLMPEHIAQIRKRDSSEDLLRDAKVCNILDMSGIEDVSFDAVLCMGALYHLFTAEDRKRAVDECLRVLKPDGLFAAAYVSRHAQLVSALSHKGMEKYDAALDCIESGIFDAENGGLVFYRSTPAEIISLMESADLEKQYMVGTDGIAHIIAELINSMNPPDFDRWLQYHYSTCEDETLLGYSLHGLYIGKKPM
ncbi:MAG: class I SAM-dependent methyltransferase [Peptococcaceae bacterium]|jgi:ubiquinone/menaquinone biosynthesis C-methylase UbiE|nr:class I SAM-dependent methyltransferase [Peptococcaceae bacterium]